MATSKGKTQKEIKEEKRLHAHNIMEKVRNTGINAYQLAQETNLTEAGAQKIIKGITTNPQTSTIEILEAWINKREGIETTSTEVALTNKIDDDSLLARLYITEGRLKESREQRKVDMEHLSETFTSALSTVTKEFTDGLIRMQNPQ